MGKYLIAISFAVLVALALSLPVDNVVSGREKSEQNAEYGDQYEGDMILNKEQLAALSSSGRNGLINTKYRWPNKTVPYQLSDDHTQEQRDYIEKGLRTLESVSCVKFVRRTDETNYVNLTGETDGCYSSVGYQNRSQNLNLAPYEPGTGCFRIGTIMHEFLHALGFYHMQSAHDRDDYVKIVWDNITPGMEHNFNKYNSSVVTHFNTTYDYGSVLHYGAFGFSKNGNATIVPNDGDLGKIGQRERLSEKDIWKLNKMYECDNEPEPEPEPEPEM